MCLRRARASRVVTSAVLPEPGGPPTKRTRPRPPGSRCRSESNADSSCVAADQLRHLGIDGWLLDARGQQLRAQGLRCATGLEAELRRERPLEPLVLAQCSRAIPLLERAPDERHVGVLIRRVDGDELLPPLGQPQHSRCSAARCSLGALAPRLVTVVGQEVTTVGRHSVLGHDRVRSRQGRLGCALELLHVADDLVAPRPQGDHLAGEDHGVRGPQRLACVVSRLVQARCRVVDEHVGPQRVEDLLAVQAPSRREGEELDE